MISVDGYTVIPRKAKAGYEWSCTGEWKVVRIPGSARTRAKRRISPRKTNNIAVKRVLVLR